MDYVPYAVPFFLIAILVELAYGIVKKKNTYRLNDAISSLFMGTLRTANKLIIISIGGYVFYLIETNNSLWRMDASSPLVWVFAFVAYDFCYYWFHRISHERQIFWASHVAHHQSEDYNLSTALRQTGTGALVTWVFYIPVFLIGVPSYVFISVATINLIYQFWVHSEHIPKLGWYENFFVTASNHRVHHAQNESYIDKNYGGLLIIWDRLFGTFKEEDEHQTPIYGIRTALKSWNPAWANLHVFVNMARDAWHAARWSDKVRVLWARTGWRPADVAARHPVDKADLKNFHKYDPKLSNKTNVGIVGQYFLVSFFHLWGAQQAAQLSIELLWAIVIAQAYTLIVIGALLEGKKSASFVENTRLLVLSAMLYIGFSAGFLAGDWLYYAIALLLVSAGLMRWCLSVDSDIPNVAGSEPI